VLVFEDLSLGVDELVGRRGPFGDVNGTGVGIRMSVGSIGSDIVE